MAKKKITKSKKLKSGVTTKAKNTILQQVSAGNHIVNKKIKTTPKKKKKEPDDKYPHKRVNKETIQGTGWGSGELFNEEGVKAALQVLGGTPDQNAVENFKARYMITYDNKLRYMSRFNRYQYQNQFIGLNGTREYIFFTKPKLNIMRNSKNLNKKLKNDPFWIEMKMYYRRIIAYLQGDDHGGMSRTSNNTDYRHVFIPLLTNMVAGNLDMPSKSAETSDTAANIYGTTMQYRKGSYKSDEGYDFSLEFYDDRWLDVYHLFRMWDEYESLKDLGVVGPPGPNSCNGYRMYKRLHDQIAIYKFIVDADDMSTILYYAKFTGCFPKSVPREAFSELKSGIISYSVDWHAQFVEDMNPIILREFNCLCDQYLKRAGLERKSGGAAPSGDSWGHYAANYNPEAGYMRFADSGFVMSPYIVRVGENYGHSPSGTSYRLIWLDKGKNNQNTKLREYDGKNNIKYDTGYKWY